MFIAKKFNHRDQWSLFFTRLQVEEHEFDHWQDESKDKDSSEPILIGLKEWIKKPLPKDLEHNNNFEEIKNWLLLVLESDCERKDIADEIKNCNIGKK